MPDMLLEVSGEITPESMKEMGPKQKQHPVVDVEARPDAVKAILRRNLEC